MLITVMVQPRAARPGVERTAAGEYKVRVGAAPDRGRANEEAVEILAAHFGLPKSRLAVIRGTTSRIKVVEVLE